jgi:RNA polymerase sigma-70 factor, ECF subfamily
MMPRTPPIDVTEHVPALLRYARSLLRDEAGTEDLVQDVLVAAYANAASYTPDRPLRSWLFTILHNRFVSDARRAAVRERHRAALAEAPPPVQPPEQETHLRLRQIERSLRALGDDQRAVLHLVAVEGLSYQEAAAVLAIPIGTLISRLSRARARLREIEDGAVEPPVPATHLRVVKD